MYAVKYRPARNERGAAASRLALILSIIALIIAVMAYNRTGQNLNDRVKTEVQRSLNNADNTINNSTR